MKKPIIKKLDTGLTVIVIPRESLSTTVLALVNTGSCFEEKSENGISHFLEHMCFKGTKKQSGKEIMRFLDGLGAETNAFTSYELTGYYVKSINKHWKKTLKVVADIFLNPAFPKGEIEKERGVIIGEMGMYEDMPMYRVRNTFTKLLYGDQPIGRSIIGTKEIINKIKREDLISYHQKHYVAEATTLVVSGNVNQREVFSFAKKYFQEIQSAPRPRKEKTRSLSGKPRIEVISQKTDQTHIVLGYESYGYHNKDIVILKVLGVILGGGMSSRLFERLREDMGVGYYVGAEHFAVSDSGVLMIRCGVDSTRVSEVLSAIREELFSLSQNFIEENELKKTKEYMVGNMFMDLESTDEISHYYGQEYLSFGYKMSSPREFANEIQSVTIKDIRRVARKIFKDERLCIAFLGPHTQKDKKTFLKAIKSSVLQSLKNH